MTPKEADEQFKKFEDDIIDLKQKLAFINQILINNEESIKPANSVRVNNTKLLRNETKHLKVLEEDFHNFIDGNAEFFI